MKRWFVPCCLLILLGLSQVAAAQRQPAGIWIVSGDDRVKAAGAELSHWLKRATGKALVENAEGPAFVLGIADQGGWPRSLDPWIEKVNQQSSTEAYAVVLEPQAGRIYLIGRTNRALKPAVYGYLHQLGFRWYFPSDKWTVVPAKVDAYAVTEGLTAPAFIRRTMFGTGGFGPKLPPDPEAQVAEQWKQWQERNRFGGEVVPTGHAGDQILAAPANREVFEKNPDWRAMINGERVPMAKSFKFCNSNPEFQKWFVENRLQTLAATLEKDPETLGISADPSDGAGHCECPDCVALGSISDRVFTLANLAARAVAEKFPGKRVAVNAYNQHADVPSIPLEPNLYVQVIPYAFQRTGMTPEEMLAAWGRKKQRNLGVYDYWSITDWAHCQPSLNYDRTIPEKIRFWHRSNLDSVGIESTYSAGAIGLQAYVASRLYWNPDEDVAAIAGEFFERMFGPAQKPMRRMMDRWGSDYRLTPQEIALSYVDLKEASTLAGSDPAVQGRIRDYIGYVYYLQRLLELHQATADDQRVAAGLALLDAIWGTHHTTMVQSYRMHRLLISRMIGKEPGLTLASQWDVKDASSPGWARWKPLGDAELDAVLAEGLKTYPVLYEPAYYALDQLQPMATGAAEGADSEWVIAPPRFGGGRFAVLRADDASPVQVLITGTPLKARITISRFGDEQPVARVEVGEWDWTDLPVPQAKGVYEIHVQPMGTFTYQLRAKPGMCLTALDRVECRQVSHTTTFYVAPKQKTIVLHTPGIADKTAITLYDGENRPVPVNEGLLKIVGVPPGQDGKIWSIRGHAGNRTQPIVFLNGPRVYGFSRAGMLIPATPVAHEVPITKGAEPAEPEDAE